MPLRKTAIALPEDLLAEVDESARERGWSRSRLITEILRRAVRARRDREVTRKLDALFAEPVLRESACEEAATWEGISVEWDDERW